MPNSLIVPGGRPQEAPPEPAPNQEIAGPVDVKTAFVVYQRADDSTWQATEDLDVELTLERKATNDDFTAACSLLYDAESDLCLAPVATVEAITAFVLYQLPSGLWQTSDDLAIPLIVERGPRFEEVLGAYAVTLRDAQTREVLNLVMSAIMNSAAPAIVQGVIQGQLQFGAALREKMVQDKLAEQLEADKNRRAGGR